jgi:Ca-activated chloride channel homolog
VIVSARPDRLDLTVLSRTLSALILLAVSWAAPASAQQAAPNDLLLILDASGSMWARNGGVEKIVIARRVLKDLAARLPDGSGVGLIAYGHRREADCADIETIVPLGPLDRAALVSKVDAINPKGKTPITQSIEQAVAAVKGRAEPATIVLLSDGIETCSGDPCAAVGAAKKAGANFLLHVIGFDLSKENVASLECTAQAGGGLYFDAKNADELAAALDRAVEPPAAAGDSVLSVKALQNGALLDATVVATDAATGKEAGSGRTYTAASTNPRVLPLPAGTYNVVVRAVGIRGDVRQNFDGVVLKAGETVEKIADFSTGELSVLVTRNGELSDATVSVYEPGTRKQVSGGRTYRAATSNPKIVSLTAGTYDVAVASVERVQPGIERFEGVTIQPGERLELKHDYVSGVLSVGAKNGAELIDAVVTIYAAGERAQLVGGRTYTAATSNPKAFVLSPGIYRVVAAPIRLAGNPKQEKQVEVTAGNTAEWIVNFAP